MKKGNIFFVILSFLIGIVFVFSAWSKTDPIQYFEYIIHSQLSFSQFTAKVLARFFIGLEAALGLLLMINIFGYKKWVLKTCLGLLIIFSIHLIYLLATVGNDVNCGCMGNIAPMSPALSLLKNAALIVGILLLWKYYKSNDSKTIHIATIPVSLIILALPFFIYPIQKQEYMPLSKMYNSTESESPLLELRKGKHILCFMSLSCKHCREAARLLGNMKKNNSSLPIYFAFSNGDSSTQQQRFKDFMKETQATTVPYHFLSPKDFTDMVLASGSDAVPVILWIEDTAIIRKIYIPELNQKEIELWIEKR